MKKKKRDFGAWFWSGTRKHSAVGLLETFFQFNDMVMVKEALTTMVQYSVREKVRITGHPEEIFHLHQALRSLVLACCIVGEETEKGAFQASPETHPPMLRGSLDDARGEEERRIVIPYLQLMKILDAAWLIVERKTRAEKDQ